MSGRSSILVSAALAGLVALAAPADEKSHKLTSVSTRKMADALHAVIAADRQAYSELIVQRLLGGELRLPGTNVGHPVQGPPVHAQLLRTAAQSIQQRGAEFSYTLRSLWPINASHGPQTQVEQTGLEYVAKHASEAYYTEEELGGRSYFTGVYPDVATLSSCVECHNQHPASARRDFRVGEVMGAIVVRVPLEF